MPNLLLSNIYFKAGPTRIQWLVIISRFTEFVKRTFMMFMRCSMCVDRLHIVFGDWPGLDSAYDWYIISLTSCSDVWDFFRYNSVLQWSFVLYRAYWFLCVRWYLNGCIYIYIYIYIETNDPYPASSNPPPPSHPATHAPVRGSVFLSNKTEKNRVPATRSRLVSKTR